MSFVPAIAPTVATAWPQAARAARSSAGRNYEHLFASGYADILAGFELGPTWDPASPLNNMPVFQGCPAQRIDHFLVHTDAKLKATAAERCFTEPCVKAKGGKLDVTLSDHYGIRATLRRA